MPWLLDACLLGFMQLRLARVFTGFLCGVEFWSFLENAARLFRSAAVPVVAALCRTQAGKRRRSMSRGLDNRNPGNIRRSRVRYKGEVHPRPTRSSSSSAAQRGLPGRVRRAAHLPRAAQPGHRGADDRPLGAAVGEPHRPLCAFSWPGACGVAEDEVLDTLDGGTMIPWCAPCRAWKRRGGRCRGRAARLGALRGGLRREPDGREDALRACAEPRRPSRRMPREKTSRRGAPQCRAAPVRAPGAGSRKRRNSTKSRGTTGYVCAFPLSFAGMNASLLRSRIERLPMLRALLPFVAGIVAAGIICCPPHSCGRVSRCREQSPLRGGRR